MVARSIPGTWTGGMAWIVAGTVAVFIDAPMRAAAEDEKPAAPASSLAPDLLELVAAHNRERAAEKLAPLTPDAMLTAAALVQARDMAAHDKMSHEGSDGSKF